MDQSLEVTDIKYEATNLTSSDQMEISTVIHMHNYKQENSYLIHTELNIMMESQEDENEFPLFTSTFYEICHYDDIKFETEEPLIKIEYLENEIMQDPLNVDNEIEGEEHMPIDLDQSGIKTEPTVGQKDENISETDKEDLHDTRLNQGQQQLLIRNDSDRKDKKYICDVCNKTFTQKGGLNRHLRIHTGTRSFICDVCEITFTQKSNLDTHMLIHSGEKPYVCDVCQKAFNQKATLHSHKFIHSDKKLFPCNYCNKSFTLKHHLVIHKRIHTGEKPYACKMCKKTFIDKSNLNRHTRLHTGEKPYSCDNCNISFTRRESLNQHKKIHKN